MQAKATERRVTVREMPISQLKDKFVVSTVTCVLFESMIVTLTKFKVGLHAAIGRSTKADQVKNTM